MRPSDLQENNQEFIQVFLKIFNWQEVKLFCQSMIPIVKIIVNFHVMCSQVF